MFIQWVIDNWLTIIVACIALVIFLSPSPTARATREYEKRRREHEHITPADELAETTSIYGGDSTRRDTEYGYGGTPEGDDDSKRLTQSYEMREAFPAVGKECVVYRDKSTNRLYWYSIQTSQYYRIGEKPPHVRWSDRLHPLKTFSARKRFKFGKK